MNKLLTSLAGGLLAVLVGAVFLSAGCDQQEPARKIDLSQRTQISPRKEIDSLTYACLPQYSHRVSFSRHHLLIEYIHEKTGLSIRQVFPDTFEEHVQMVGAGEIDFSFSNPLVYARIADLHQAKAFARIVEKNGTAGFRGQIICRADNKAIKNLEDCKNKRWMAVDPSSAAGYLFAVDHFLRHGISANDFKEISFARGPAGKQEKVVQAVYLGQSDIGSIREGTLELMEDRIDPAAIRVLDTTRKFPSWVYAAAKDLDQDLIKKVKQALVELDPDKPEHRRILEQARFKKIIPARDSDFDPIRSLKSKIEGKLHD
ncbi:MAG: phosphate/phosphite/phosphonate ABC transporter substrate-binding protein [Desulfosalsimonas sp.]